MRSLTTAALLSTCIGCSAGDNASDTDDTGPEPVDQCTELVGAIEPAARHIASRFTEGWAGAFGIQVLPDQANLDDWWGSDSLTGIDFSSEQAVGYISWAVTTEKSESISDFRWRADGETVLVSRVRVGPGVDVPDEGPVAMVVWATPIEDVEVCRFGDLD